MLQREGCLIELHSKSQDMPAWAQWEKMDPVFESHSTKNNIKYFSLQNNVENTYWNPSNDTEF